MSRSGYWSLEACGWVSSPGACDALATPWSAHGLPAPAQLPRAVDAADVLRMRPTTPARAEVPVQRDGEPARQDALR